MKLRNKQTGEIGELNYYDGFLQVVDTASPLCGNSVMGEYTTFSAINEEWEDYYEEPKEYWYVSCDGRALKATTDEDDYNEKHNTGHKQIGNYFETKEEAEKAAEKLKAWHKLMDYWQTEALGWEIRDMPTGGNWQTVNVKFNVKTRKEPMELLDLIFGGEE